MLCFGDIICVRTDGRLDIAILISRTVKQFQNFPPTTRFCAQSYPFKLCLQESGEKSFIVPSSSRYLLKKTYFHFYTNYFILQMPIAVEAFAVFCWSTYNVEKSKMADQ